MQVLRKRKFKVFRSRLDSSFCASVVQQSQGSFLDPSGPIPASARFCFPIRLGLLLFLASGS